MTLCFDVGATEIRAAIFGANEPGAIKRTATPRDDRAAFLREMRRLAEAAPAGAPASVAICGRIEPATGALSCANVPCIDGAPIAELLGAGLGRPVRVANDADCFTLAEAQRGAGRGAGVVFGVILGTGVGGGLVIDGQLVPGAGEWGHGPAAPMLGGDPERAIPWFDCGCGLRGCLDTVGGAPGLARLHAHLHAHQRGRAADSRAIVAGWRAGDAEATATVSVWRDLVSGPLAMTLNAVGADIAPVGGGLAGAPDLIATLDAAVRARVVRTSPTPVVVVGRIEIAPGLVGAALLDDGAQR